MEKFRAVTIGFFDGVHRGHRYLLQQLEELAADNGLMPVAVTFDQHPRQVLDEDFIPSLLTTQKEKLTLLSEVFNGEVVVLPFTKELSTLSAKEFMQSVLRKKLKTELLNRRICRMGKRDGHQGLPSRSSCRRKGEQQQDKKPDKTGRDGGIQ